MRPAVVWEARAVPGFAFPETFQVRRHGLRWMIATVKEIKGLVSVVSSDSTDTTMGTGERDTHV